MPAQVLPDCVSEVRGKLFDHGGNTRFVRIVKREDHVKVVADFAVVSKEKVVETCGGIGVAEHCRSNMAYVGFKCLSK